MTAENILTIDKQVVMDIFAEAIRREATAVIKAAVTGEDIARTIREAFAKRWASNRDTWLEQSVRDAMEQVMCKSVQDAIKGAGVADMIKVSVTEYVGTQEFAETIKQRAIETVNSMTFCVNPKE